jgi:uncharacterized DUF497 family protein
MHRFDWDSRKANRNAAKHGVTFVQAARVFDDPHALMVLERVVDGVDIIRIVSARRGLRYERQRYENQAQ